MRVAACEVGRGPLPLLGVNADAELSVVQATYITVNYKQAHNECSYTPELEPHCAAAVSTLLCFSDSFQCGLQCVKAGGVNVDAELSVFHATHIPVNYTLHQRT